MSSCWPSTIHVSAKVGVSWCGECRVCDSLCIQAKPNFMRVVLRNRQRSWYHLGLMTISPSRLVLIRIILASWLQSLKISEVEDLLRVGDELAFLELRHGVGSEMRFVGLRYLTM